MAREVTPETPSPAQGAKSSFPGEVSVDLKEFYLSDGYTYLIDQLKGLSKSAHDQAIQMPTSVETPYRRYLVLGAYIGIRDCLTLIERLCLEAKERQ